ncbi:DNA replication protein DnaD [Paucisalibacillus globulus]|uniref:DNA replication protein DnaD n=1 Tax=Paucisalibacillus globulus TaxID=351095 RepID=UPI000BB8790C|nr:DNA replication protein DnaD [Paucisalibacillus globulus]
MAKFRMVHTEFWDDPKVVEEMTPEDKLFFLYLLTNSNTTQIGIYQITKKQMAFDTGYSIESINSLLDRFIKHHKLIIYNQETREIAIKNWGRYNLNRGGKPMIDCVTSELKSVKDESLINFVAENIKHSDIKGLYDTYTSRGQYKEKEEEKEEEDKDKENPVRALFEHYISKNIIAHKKLTSPMKTAIKSRLKDYEFDELIKAIDNYAFVLNSPNHWFTHKYPLADFMRDKDVRRFLDEADPLNNFMEKSFRQTDGQAFSYDPNKDAF